MPLHLRASLDGLLSLLAGCFTQPGLQTFRALVVGQISQTGFSTVTGCSSVPGSLACGITPGRTAS